LCLILRFKQEGGALKGLKMRGPAENPWQKKARILQKWGSWGLVKKKLWKEKRRQICACKHSGAYKRIRAKTARRKESLDWATTPAEKRDNSRGGGEDKGRIEGEMLDFTKKVIGEVRGIR